MTITLRGFLGTVCVLGAAIAPGWAHALSCMVVGEKTARVKSSEGEKSPAFLSNACESLRLVSGKAMVSWIARDGKPNFSPIGADGVKQLPAAGAAERSASVVWAEMTTSREVSRPAFMRALDEQRPARVYIPAEGLAIPSGARVSVRLVDNKSEKPVVQNKKGNEALRVTREGLTPGAEFTVELTGGSKPEKWLLKQVDEAETQKIEAQLAAIAAADVDDAQRQILQAMLYEQLKLPVNMALTLQNGR